MSEELLLATCSPTMAGLKTASMYSCPIGDRETFERRFGRIRDIFYKHGIMIIPLKYMTKRVLLYMYRPDMLKRDLDNDRAKEILQSLGYPVGDMNKCMEHLIYHLNKDEHFPHEIGLFLGYPPEDVAGFMYEGAHMAKCVGTWRVYSNESVARKRFDMFKRCTRVYSNAYKRHHSLEKLIVN